MSEAITAFAAAAERYCAWAEGEASAPRDDARAGRLLVAELYRRALDLPATEGSDRVVPAVDGHERVYRRFGSLPFNYYSECFDPLIVPAEEPVVADLADDLADIWRDVKTGLVLFRHGDGDEAAWQWRFMLESHWAHHASAALYALQAWFSSNSE